MRGISIATSDLQLRSFWSAAQQQTQGVLYALFSKAVNVFQRTVFEINTLVSFNDIIRSSIVYHLCNDKKLTAWLVRVYRELSVKK